jgi:hypothetical protein
MHARISALFLVFALAITGLAGAQETSGAITGRITDAQGLAVPGTTVTVTNNATGAARSFVTDADGRYTAPNLAPGRYKVSFEITGFKKVERDDIDILLGRTFTLDAKLDVGSLTETVQVTGEATPLVDVRSTVVQHNVPAEEFDQLPKARSFQAIAMTSPSVNQGEVEGGFQVNGASGAENQYTVDGVATNSLVNGSSRQNTVFEYLQEVQVKTTGIPAEYGGALGGVVSAVTKSGGNIFSGEGHYYYEGSAIGAGPVQRLVLNPRDDVSVGNFREGKQPVHRNEVGGSLGGPIVRNKLFFFGSISPRYSDITREYNFNSGTETGQLERKDTNMSAFGKITYQNDRLRADFSTLYTPTTSTGRLPDYDGFGSRILSSSLTANQPNLTRGYKVTQRNMSGSADWTLSNSSIVSFKVGQFRDNYTDTGIPNVANYTYQTSSIGFALVPANLQGPINTLNTPRALINDHDTTKQTFFNADYNQAFSAAGSHTLKGGFGIRRNVNDVLQAYPGGYVDIFWDRTFPSSVAGVGSNRGVYGYYAVNDRGVRGVASANIISLYAQDQWTVSSRLTLNLGIRTENEKIPSFRTDIKEVGIEFPFSEKIAPRIGAAYDVFGDGRMKVFGSWGRYYDWTKYELARGTFGADTWKIYYRALDTLDVGSLNLSNMPGRDIWGSTTGFRDRRVPAFETVDPDIKPMSQDGVNLGWEYQLGNEMVFSSTWVHNNLIRTIEDLGALVNGDEVYQYANPGEGIATITPISGRTAPFKTPKPKRQYDALQFVLNKRFAQNWFGGVSYVYSRLYGNYAGIASSDEILTPTTNVTSAIAQQQVGSISRGGGNANRAWDIDELLWDSKGHLNVLGNLATDRPHVAKVYGSYQFPFGTQVGASFYGASGTPMTTYVNTVNQTQVMVNGRGDMGRTPVLTQTDLIVSHELKSSGAKRVRLELQVLNAFNQQTARHIFNSLNRGAGAARPSSSIDLSNVDLAKGYDYNALIRATPDGANAFDPRYGKPDLFSPGTQGQFLVKFLF